MPTFCPRCEAAWRHESDTCQSCGYRLRTICSVCGHQNIRSAAFCGSCGIGLTWRRRLEQSMPWLISSLTGKKARSFGAGILYGSLITVFAFGTLGMTSPRAQDARNTLTALDGSRFEQIPPRHKGSPATAGISDQVPNTSSEAALRRDLQGSAGATAWRRLSQRFTGRSTREVVTATDVQEAANILLEVYTGPFFPELPTSFKDSFYSRILPPMALGKSASLIEQPLVTRGTVAQFLFRTLTELFCQGVIDKPSEPLLDLPRFHFLNVVAGTLVGNGFQITRTTEEFGERDPMTRGEFLRHLEQLVAVGERQRKVHHFPTLALR
jgi:hypothetical protein